MSYPEVTVDAVFFSFLLANSRVFELGGRESQSRNAANIISRVDEEFQFGGHFPLAASRALSTTSLLKCFQAIQHRLALSIRAANDNNKVSNHSRALRDGWPVAN